MGMQRSKDAMGSWAQCYSACSRPCAGSACFEAFGRGVMSADNADVGPGELHLR
jgi:hypothetical protein